jgi:hypothetical protein
MPPEILGQSSFPMRHTRLSAAYSLELIFAALAPEEIQEKGNHRTVTQRVIVPSLYSSNR